MKRLLSITLVILILLGIIPINSIQAQAAQEPEPPIVIASPADDSIVTTWTGVADDLYRYHTHTKGNGVPIIIMPVHFGASDLAAGGKLQTASKWAADLILSTEQYIFPGFADYLDIYVYIQSDAVSPVPTSGYTDAIIGEKFSKLHELAQDRIGWSDGFNVGLEVRTIYLGNSDNAGQIGGHAYKGIGALLSWGNQSGTSTPWEADPPYWALHEFLGHGFAALADEYVTENYTQSSGNIDPNLYVSASAPAETDVSWKNFIGFEEKGQTHGIYKRGDSNRYHPTDDSFMNTNPNMYVPMYHKWIIYKKVMDYAGTPKTLANFCTFMGITLPGGTGGGIGGSLTVPSDGAPTIDLATETINLGGFDVAAYSLNGGTKWTKGALPADDKFKKLLDKGITLWLTDGWNDKDIKEDKTVVAKKGIAAGANIIKFPKINARPKANADKLKPAYPNDTHWVMAKKGSTAAVYDGYKVAPTSDKKTPSGEWMDMPAEGIALIAGKTKPIYLFRSMPSTSGGGYTPGSKIFKVSPANYGKAPAYKIDYKKEIIKLKKGDSYSIGGAAYTTISDAKGKELDMAELLTGRTAISIKKTFAGKKPPTEAQLLTPLERGTLEGTELSCAKGTISANMKIYEVYDSAKKKWGNVPKVTSSKTFDIRVKATAKGTGGNAASVTGSLTVTYGPYEENGKSKNGITNAEIFPAGYKPGPTDADKIALAKATIEAISDLKAGSSTVVAMNNQNEAWNAVYARVQELYEGGAFPEGVTVECAGSAKNGTDFYSVSVTIRCGNASGTADAKVTKNNSSVKVTISGNTSATGFVLNFDMSIFTSPSLGGGIGGYVHSFYTYTGSGSLTTATVGGSQWTPTITFVIAGAVTGDKVSLNSDTKYYDDKSLPVVVPEITWNGTTWSLAG